MRVITFNEAADVIKDIPKRLDLGLLDIKRKPRPVVNAPPIDAFPTYDEQAGTRCG